VEDHTPEGLVSARRQRREMSLPEGLLWHQLRQRPLGIKFRKLHPIGNLVVDFYCARHRLVVEIDGISPDMGDGPERDARRDAWLRSEGYRVVRIPAVDVLCDPIAAAQSVVAICSGSPPPSALRAATSPRGGDSTGVSI
jgi:very-short-patch-repair endonuclease